MLNDARCVIVFDSIHSSHLTLSFSLRSQNRLSSLCICPGLKEIDTLPLPYRHERAILFPRLSSFLEASLETESEMLRPQGASCLPLQAGGCYVEKLQWSRGVLALGQGRLRSGMITVLSLKIFAPSVEPLQVCWNQEQAGNRNRSQGKSILTSRLGCHYACTALSRIKPLVSESEPRLLFSQGPSPTACSGQWELRL